MTRGERNNNPLNIRRVVGTHWRGETERAGEQEFVTFSSVAWGLRAAFQILKTYRDKYKAVCIEDIIRRWAPPSENDTNAYIYHVCKATGFGGKERLTENEWPALVKAMAWVESRMDIADETMKLSFELYSRLKNNKITK